MHLASILHRCQQEAREVYRRRELANCSYVKMSVENKNGDKFSIEGSAKHLHVGYMYNQYSEKKAITET